MNDDELKMLWKRQPTPDVRYSIDELRRASKRFQRRVAFRNATEYLACLVVVAVFAMYLVKFPFPLMRAGSVLIILGTLWVAHQLRARASGRPVPGDMGDRSWVDFHREQVLRQRDALRAVWLWYVAPFVPGMVVFRWGVETELDAGAPFARGWAANLAIAGVLLLVVAFNRFAARRLQRRIDELDAQARGD